MFQYQFTHLHSSRVIPFRPPSTSSRSGRDISNSPVPHIHHIVVSTARKQFSVAPPFKPTHFSLVSQQFSHLVSCNPNVVVPDTSISASRAQNVAVPGQTCNLTRVSSHGPKFRPSFNIPKLNIPITHSHPEELAIVRKVNRRDILSFSFSLDLAQVHYLPTIGFPNISVLRKGNSKSVVTTPTDQVQIIVVHNSRRIQHPFWL